MPKKKHTQTRIVLNSLLCYSKKYIKGRIIMGLRGVRFNSLRL